MASPPPPPLLLLLLLLLLPATPGARGQSPGPARREHSGAPPGGTGLRRPPEPGPERAPPPRGESRAPATPGPGQPPPGPGAATRRGPSGRVPGSARAAAGRSQQPERNTEPHLESITFPQDQVHFSTGASTEPVTTPVPRERQASPDVAERFAPHSEAANAGGQYAPPSRIDHAVSISSAGGSSELATALNVPKGTSALAELPPSSSSSSSESEETEERIAPSQTESGTPRRLLDRGKQLPEEEATLPLPGAASSVLSQSLHPAMERGEGGTPARGSRSWEPGPSAPHFSRTPAISPSSEQASSSGSITALNTLTTFSNPSVGQTESAHDGALRTAGAPRILQSLPVPLGPVNERVHLPDDSGIALTSPSSPTEEESRRDSRVTGNLGDGEVVEPSTENGFGLTSSKISKGFLESNSPTFGGPQRATRSDADSGRPAAQTETVSRPLPSVGGGAGTAQLSVTHSEALGHVTGSLAAAWTRVSDSAPPSEGSTPRVRHYSEPSTEALSASSSESLDFSAASRGERSTMEDSPELGGRPEKGSRAHALSPHTSATFTGSGERTLPDLTNGSTTSGDVGSPASVLRKTESPAWPGGMTEDTGLASGPLAATRVLAATDMHDARVSGTDADQRTSSDHADHTYASPVFTTGARALLPITENTSSTDTRGSAPSFIETANSPPSERPSSSHARTERSHAPPYDRGYTQPSTESLVVPSTDPPSYTPTVNVPNTLVLLNVDPGLVGSSFSPSEPLGPLSSVSQAHPWFASTPPSTGASAPPLMSTSEAAWSSSPPSLPTSLRVSILASSSSSHATVSHPAGTQALPRAEETSGMSAGTWTVASSLAVAHSSQTADARNQEEIMTEPKSLPTTSAEPVTTGSLSGVPLAPASTQPSLEQTLPVTSTSLARVSPPLRVPTPQTAHPPVTAVGLPSSTAALLGSPTTVQTAAGTQRVPLSPETLAPHSSTQGAVTAERTLVHLDSTTSPVPLTRAPASAREASTGRASTEAHNPAPHPSQPSLPPQTTDAPTAPGSTLQPTAMPAQGSTQSPRALPSPASVDSCASSPCLHDGNCTVEATRRGYHCVCPPSWQGDDCSVDVNECLLNPCPPLATCDNTQGSFTCTCPVGYQLEKGICNLVRTFVTELKLKKTFLNATLEKLSDVREAGDELTKMLNVCFSPLPGYTRSTVHASRESSVVAISLQTTFSLTSNVTLFDLADTMQKCVNSCRSSAEVCQLLGSQRRIFRAGSLCKRKSPECDRETSICTDLDGVALCQCKSGYFQFNKMDHSCRACEDGYRLENKTCMSCPFGLGGLNCGNPYQLITVVIAAAGGGLLLILGIALIVTCCRKSKNDISKLIFKSGDFQMSPYAEYPKNPRSQEWGREAIEMHENGSTKNLLQMPDAYYSILGWKPAEVSDPLPDLQILDSPAP
ncbi:protein HEG homolog 1 isoform X1 [Tenrec ecaudatus]|uniref:protein HEG homolog 1 isoform X1 n=1 Tax=Tenrec ecaudatus TaxID=94439 RepID=UPI003F5A02CD